MKSLQKQKYTSFKDVVSGFGDLYVDQRWRWLYSSATWVWRKIFGVDTADHIILDDFEKDQDGFWHDDWIFKEIFYPEISATLVGHLSLKELSERTANLIYSAIEFYLESRSGRLKPEVFSGFEQDMSRYQYFFSRITISSKSLGKMLHTVRQESFSDFIVLGLRGRLFKIKVLSDDGLIVSRGALLEEVRKLFASTSEIAPEYTPPLSLLTASQSSRSLYLWGKFASVNTESVQLLNQALFFVSVTPEFKANSIDARLRGLHLDFDQLRDQRRSMQIVVGGDGAFGITVNPHAGLGGTLSARLLSELYCRTKAFELSSVEEAEVPMDLSFSEEIIFKDPKFSDQKLSSLRAEILSRIYSEAATTTFDIHGVGAKDLRDCGYNVDAAFHAALVLAWKRTRGYVPTVGNFINLRSIKHGDIWRYNASTDEMIRFAFEPTLANYRSAEVAHKNVIKKNKSGQDEFYVGAMSLKRLVNEGHVRFSAFVSLVLILSLFVRRFSRRFLNPDIWISGIPTYEGLESVGRAGSMMSYLAPTSSGGHYMIFEHRIMLCLLNPKGGKWLGSEEDFANAVGQSLRDIVGLVKNEVDENCR